MNTYIIRELGSINLCVAKYVSTIDRITYIKKFQTTLQMAKNITVRNLLFYCLTRNTYYIDYLHVTTSYIFHNYLLGFQRRVRQVFPLHTRARVKIK